MNSLFDRVIAIIFAGSALFIAIVYGIQHFGGGASPRAPALEMPDDVFVSDWSELVESGVIHGVSSAPVTIIQFVDFECPFCARFHDNMGAILKQYGDDLRVVTHHFPLEGLHRFARSAGVAYECAVEQGVAVEMAHSLYAQQDSFGLRPWAAYAQEAGVEDLVSFDACIDKPTTPRIDLGLDVAVGMEFVGTPTVMVNGWLFGTAPSPAELRGAIERELNGKAALEGDTVELPAGQD